MTTTTSSDITYTPLTRAHFNQVIALGNDVHGENYLTPSLLETIYQKGWHKDINASFVALYQGDVVGFRLTYAHSQWQRDSWCTPSKWPVAESHVCYFKCNTVSPHMQGTGIGSALLRLSIQQAKLQGAEAGLAHIWLASPGNSAFKYFSKNGGVLINKHPGKWRQASIYEGYDCPVCVDYCECEGAEMMLTFTS